MRPYSGYHRLELTEFLKTSGTGIETGNGKRDFGPHTFTRHPGLPRRFLQSRNGASPVEIDQTRSTAKPELLRHIYIWIIADEHIRNISTVANIETG
jgi:hypothetical protein